MSKKALELSISPLLPIEINFTNKIYGYELYHDLDNVYLWRLCNKITRFFGKMIPTTIETQLPNFDLVQNLSKLKICIS